MEKLKVPTPQGMHVDFAVTNYENNHLLYDYYNFPEEMYKVKFESKGSPQVASRVVELLKQVRTPPTMANARTISWRELSNKVEVSTMESSCLSNSCSPPLVPFPSSKSPWTDRSTHNV